MGELVGRVIHPSVWHAVVGKLGSDGTEPVISWQLGHERLLANVNARAALDADDRMSSGWFQAGARATGPRTPSTRALVHMPFGTRSPPARWRS